MSVFIPEHLLDTISQDFSAICKVCGEPTRVVDGRLQPHRCRIEVP